MFTVQYSKHMQLHMHIKFKYRQRNTKTNAYTNADAKKPITKTLANNKTQRYTQIQIHAYPRAKNTNSETQRHTQIQICMQIQIHIRMQPPQKTQKQIQTATQRHTRIQIHIRMQTQKNQKVNSLQYNTSQSLYVLHHAEHLPIELDETVPVVLVRSKRQRRDLAETCLGRKTGTTGTTGKLQGQACHPDAMFSHCHAAPTWTSKVWSGHELYQCRWLRLSSTWKKRAGCCPHFLQDKWNRTFFYLPWTECAGAKRIQHNPTGIQHCGMAPHP